MRFPAFAWKLGCAAAMGSMIYGCSPEPGSKAWCEQMRDKPRGEWTANDAAQFAKSCVFRNDS